MALMDHIRELRSRLFKAALALIVGALVTNAFYGPVFDFITSPYCDNAGINTLNGTQNTSGCSLIQLNVLDGFSVRLRVALTVGALLSAPFWLYQLWAFITPGLRRGEKRYALIFVGVSTLLFAAGAALAYITMSKGLAFLIGLAGDSVTPLIDVTSYLRYFTAMALVFGISFEFPLLVIMLNVIGVASHAKLAGWRRGMIFGVFVFAAVATPSQDPFSMLALALPMCLLYELSLIFTRLHDRRAARRERIEGYAGFDDDEASPLDPTPSEAVRATSRADDIPSHLDDLP